METEQQIAFLTGLLDHYSPTLQEAPAVDYLAGWMKGQGFQVNVDEAGNVIGSLGDGQREILLLGHIDTVPGLIPVHQEGDLLFGRGSVDAKGPLACFALAALLCGSRPGWKVTVVGAVGEEGGSPGAKLVRDTRQPECCVIGEPSGWDHVTLGYKGSAWFEYGITRSMAHTAGQAGSACDAALSFWNAVQRRVDDFNQGRERAFEQLGASLRGMNSSSDGFSEQAGLAFNLRLPPDLMVSQAVELVAGERGGADLRLVDGVECYRADKNNALVRALLAAIRAEQGQPGFLVKTGTSDMNIVGPAWNVPILAYGPGDSSLDHTPHEHISITEYLTGVRVLSQALDKLQT